MLSSRGLVTSLAWKHAALDCGKTEYVLEGNLNYTGAVIMWLKDALGLIHSPAETEELAEQAMKDDEVYLVPAFSGLGAPYWDSRAKASITGMTRATGKAEITRAALECIAYQITDVLECMGGDAAVQAEELRVDGGPTRNRYLMQLPERYHIPGYPGAGYGGTFRNRERHTPAALPWACGMTAFSKISDITDMSPQQTERFATGRPQGGKRRLPL